MGWKLLQARISTPKQGLERKIAPHLKPYVVRYHKYGSLIVRVFGREKELGKLFQLWLFSSSLVGNEFWQTSFHPVSHFAFFKMGWSSLETPVLHPILLLLFKNRLRLIWKPPFAILFWPLLASFCCFWLPNGFQITPYSSKTWKSTWKTSYGQKGV